MSRAWAVAAGLAMLAIATAANAAETLVLQLSGPAQFEFAGYYAALWQGFYNEAGLDVAIKPGSDNPDKPVDPIREVTEGRAVFGIGTSELVVRAAQGLPITLLAPIFQRSGAMIYYKASEDFASPAALAKAKIGRLPAGNSLDIELATALKAEGVDPDKVNSVSLNPGQTVSALADGTVEAAPGSAWEVPWRAFEKGVKLKSINPADYRVEFYGDTLFTLRRTAELQPQVVREFRAASLKGWDYALQHRDEIAKRIVAELPPPPGIKDAAGFAHYQADLAARLARYPEVVLGHTNPDRWARIEASIAGVGALIRTADSDSFVYDPDAMARRHNDMRSIAILGGALLAGLAVLAWLWLRRRRGLRAAIFEPAAAPAAALPEPAAAAPPASESDLNAVLARIERNLRQRLPRQAVFRLSLFPDLWRCLAEPQTVRRLVLDLAGAATADLKQKGELIVGTRNVAFDAAALTETPDAQLGEYARLTVRDNGRGFPDDTLARMLDPAASPRPAVAAAAAAMRTTGGFVRVESAEGVGTAVHLYFPRAAEIAQRKPAQAAE